MKSSCSRRYFGKQLAEDDPETSVKFNEAFHGIDVVPQQTSLLETGSRMFHQLQLIPPCSRGPRCGPPAATSAPQQHRSLCQQLFDQVCTMRRSSMQAYVYIYIYIYIYTYIHIYIYKTKYIICIYIYIYIVYRYIYIYIEIYYIYMYIIDTI